MIPILYDKNETSFTSNGLGRLSDCIRCIVTEQRNGVYECEFEYPVNGNHFDDITVGRIIACTHDDYGDVQPFDIYSKSEPINGVVTFNAHHISYRLNEIVVKPFTASSCAAALNNIGAYSVDTNPFTFWTDKATSTDYTSDVPRLARNMLGGEENSILDVFGGGEYEFDKFIVKLYVNRGQDTDVSIRYGKNLSTFTNTYNSDDEYTAIVPYWKGSVSTDGESSDVVVTLPEWSISSGQTSDNGREIYAPLDMSSEFQAEPTENDLRTAATSKLTSSSAWLPNQTVTVDFVQLWQTEEYKNFAPLQRVRLCDTVGVFVPMYNMSIRVKIISVKYNVLLERYDEMTLGDKPTTYASMVSKQVSESVASAINSAKENVTTAYQDAIDYATAKINGGMGGYVVTVTNADGQPIELCITDNLDLSLAQDIWRWNQGGFGHSSTGYSGQYTTAITQDGQINADFITAGTMTANRIQGGTLTLGGQNDAYGVLEIKNSSGTTIGTWNKDGVTAQGSMTTQTSSYYMTMDAGMITAGKISNGVKTQTGFVSPNYQYTSQNAFVFAAQTGCLVLGCDSNIYFTNKSVTGNAYASFSSSSVQLRATAIGLTGTSSLGFSIGGHLATGTGQKVIIPASLGSGGVVSSSYTFYLRSGLLCQN